MPSEKLCFLIAPIGEEGSKERDRSDQIRDFVIKPAVVKFGYKVVRADEISKSGMITSQVIQHVFESELVIAYLATENPNVFYELALRHAIRKPFIQIIEEGQKIPFDVSGLRTIQLKYGDLRSSDVCRGEIQKQIDALQLNPEEVESPVTQAVDVKALKDSSKPTEHLVGRIVEMMQEMMGQIKVLQAYSQKYYTVLSELSPKSLSETLASQLPPYSRLAKLESLLAEPELLIALAAKETIKPQQKASRRAFPSRRAKTHRS